MIILTLTISMDDLYTTVWITRSTIRKEPFYITKEALIDNYFYIRKITYFTYRKSIE